jgi:hypothetical protein
MGYFDHFDLVVGVAITTDEFFDTFREQLMAKDPMLYAEPCDDNDDLYEARYEFLESANKFLKQQWPTHAIQYFTPWNTDCDVVFVGELYAQVRRENQPDIVDVDEIATIRDRVKNVLAVFNHPVKLQVITNYA